MSRTVRAVFTVALIGLLTLMVVGSAVADGRGEPPGRFRAHLSGDEEVPPVDTRAQGQAMFKFDRDVTELSYKLIVANIDDVFAAHIHCAPAGENGPVGVTLFTGGPISPNGILAEDTVMAPDEGNACGWEDLEDVEEAIRDGGAYVNVHTLAHPPGEIRGQIH